MAAVSLVFCSERPTTTRLQPSLARVRATARPTPAPAPVTIAVRFFCSMNLALEEYVFEHMDRSRQYFMLWQNDRAVIVGKHQNTVEEVNAGYVKAHGVKVVRRLSGGNVQKVLLGREIASDPRILITAYPVRGLDINSSMTIYRMLNEQKKKGVAVLYIGEDLDVLLELCDRILVLCAGHVNGIVDGRSATKEEVGLLMTNLKKEDERA